MRNSCLLPPFAKLCFLEIHHAETLIPTEMPWPASSATATRWNAGRSRSSGAAGKTTAFRAASTSRCATAPGDETDDGLAPAGEAVPGQRNQPAPLHPVALNMQHVGMEEAIEPNQLLALEQMEKFLQGLGQGNERRRHFPLSPTTEPGSRVPLVPRSRKETRRRLAGGDPLQRL